MVSIPRKCEVKGCINTHLAKGYCSRHYQRVKNGWPLDQSMREPRPAMIEGDIAKIPLGVSAKDGYAIVDKEFAWLDRYQWSLKRSVKSKTTYAYGWVDGKQIFMHRIILSPPLDKQVDHKDRNGLNNTKSNLRIATQFDNMRNIVKPRSGKHSPYRGVTKTKNLWASSILSDGVRYYGGTFSTPEEAAKKYNELAIKYHGEFAVLNKV